MLKNLLVAAMAIVLAACGGGDISDDYVRDASRACPGPFTGSSGSFCSVELRLAGDETIRVEISGRLVAQNDTQEAGEVSRDLHVQIAGVAAGFRNGILQLEAGQSAAQAFKLSADVPAANLGSAPAVISLASFERTGSLPSSIVDVTIEATAR